MDTKVLYEIVEKAKKYEELAFIHRDSKLLSCNFCGKSQNEIDKLIAGPNVYICNECVELCVEVITEKKTQVETTQ